jgi:hypothetical protein
MVLLSVLAISALAFALLHGPCPETGKAGSDCPVCHLVRSGLYVESLPAPLHLAPAGNERVAYFECPSPCLFRQSVRQPRAPPLQEA